MPRRCVSGKDFAETVVFGAPAILEMRMRVEYVFLKSIGIYWCKTDTTPDGTRLDRI